MPKAVEAKIRASVRKAHPEYSKARVDKEVYSTMNKRKERDVPVSRRYENEYVRGRTAHTHAHSTGAITNKARKARRGSGSQRVSVVATKGGSRLRQKRDSRGRFA